MDGQRTASDASQKEVVVFGMSADGTGGAPFGHTTRTIAIGPVDNKLYVSVGSAGNVDKDSYRSRIRRFGSGETVSSGGGAAGNATSLAIPAGGWDFSAGEVFADGLRNEVGITFDAGGVLWGVENSADMLVRSDLGGDIHNQNPAEELNRFAVTK